MISENIDLTNESLPEIRQKLSAKPFRPHPLFRSGHAQTLLGFAYPRRFKFRSLLVGEERLFEVEPGVKILAHCDWQPREQRRSSATLVLVHGLEGSSNSVYILSTAAAAYKSGFNVVRLNIRTCGNTEKLTPTLYHSGMSEDLRVVINELIERDRLQHIFLAGFSLGGNMSLKLAGEWGANAPEELRGVVAVSPSIDLASCAEAIENRSNWLYNQRFVSSLKRRMRRIQKLYPEDYNLQNLAQVRTVRDFDTHYTAVHGGFSDVHDYYARASSLPLIQHILVPTLIVHAQDDPFVPFASFRDSSLESNPFVILLAPSHGGHVGFVAADSPAGENRFWSESRLIEFCQLLYSANKFKKVRSRAD